MIIRTKIAYSSEEDSVLGDSSANREEIMYVDLGEVGGVMPGDEDGKTAIVFLQGRDIMLLESFKIIKTKWLETKKQKGIILDEPLTLKTPE